MKKLSLFLFLFSLLSCNTKHTSTYKYVQTNESEDVSGKIEVKDDDPKEFEADNDSLAFIEAFTKFCISKKVQNDYIEASIKSYLKPIGYKILDEHNSDITSKLLAYNTPKTSSEIEKDIFSRENTLKKAVEERKSKPYTNDEDANPCVISEDFIKQDLRNPSSGDFSIFDCTSEKNSDGTFTILRKVGTKNSFGIEKEFIYKVTIGFKGGDWTDSNNWDLVKIQSEENR